jgi:hypothetical protein
MGVLGRRTFLLSSTVMLAGAAKPKPAHPVDEPAALVLKKIVVPDPILYGKPTPAIVAVPRELPAGTKLPLAILLPGGEHTMQKRDEGCWGWWSDFGLHEVDAAMRRGAITDDDLQKLATPTQIASLNARLPYRGMILVTPFILRRQTELGPHGVMNLKFIRALVEQVRREFPVLDDRASTGLAGVSAGALWALWLGAQLDDLFSSVVAVQPYTDGYEKTLSKVLHARTRPQTVRDITSTGDRLHAPAVAFVEKMGKEGIAIEREAYRGQHEPLFARGPGGFEVLTSLDHALARPAPKPVASASASAPVITPAPAPAPAPYRAPRSHLWPFVALSALGVGIGALAYRARRGPRV